MSKKLLALVLVLLLALSAAACAPKEPGGEPTPTPAPPVSAPTPTPKEPVELTFYYPTQVGGDLAMGMEQIVADFNAQSDWITVTPVYTGSYKQTAQKAMTDIAAKQGPNVVLSGMLDIVDYYNVDAVKDISALIAAEDPAWQADFIEGFWGNFQMGEGVYGLPFQHSVCVLYFNFDMLNAAGIMQPPSNWQDMLDTVAALKAHDKDVVPLEFPSDVWVLEAVTLSNGGSLIRSRQETAFDSPEAVASLDLLSQLVKGGAMIQEYAPAAEDFVAESAAMTINTTGNIGFVAKDATFKWGITTVPVNRGPAFSYGGGGLIMIDGQAPAEEEASWEFMKYMTSPEVSARWMTISGYFAVRKSSEDLQITKDYYEANRQLSQAAKLLKYTTAQWSTDSYWDVYDHMKIALDSVLVGGDVSAADALAKAQTDSMAVLAKQRHAAYHHPACGPGLRPGYPDPPGMHALPRFRPCFFGYGFHEVFMQSIMIGAFADTHYACRPSDGMRFYTRSLEKLRDIAARFGAMEMDLVACLGDLIDCRTDGGSAHPQFDDMMATVRTCGVPFAMTLGNHDVAALPRRDIAAATGLDPRGYGSFDVKGWHIVQLDTNYGPGGTAYAGAAVAWDDCWMDPAQLAWLEQDLAAAPGPCVVLAHANLDPRDRGGRPDPHVVKNHGEVRAVLEDCGRVRLVLQGHCHEGCRSCIRGIPYVTLRAVVDGFADTYALAIQLNEAGITMTELF